MSRSDVAYLRHMLEEAEYLSQEGARVDLAQFLADDTRKRAFVRSIEVIGEATKNLSDGMRLRHPDLAWRAMAGMRDHLIHGYFGVDYEIVWDVAANKAPELVSRLRAVIAEEESTGV